MENWGVQMVTLEPAHSPKSRAEDLYKETTVKATVPRVYCYLSSGSAVTVVDAGRLICTTCLGAEWLTGSQL